MIPKSFRSAGPLATARRILFAGMSLLCVVPAFSQKVHDAIRPLPAGAVRLDGFFENDIRNSIDHWNKGVVPYAAMVDFFRNGRSQFALGEMWGKAVRSGCFSGGTQLMLPFGRTVLSRSFTVCERISLSSGSAV